MNSQKRLTVGVAIACIALLGGAIFGGAAVAKKKKKGAKVATVSNTTPRAIPDALPGSATTPATYGKLATPLTVSKKFKKSTVGDVQLTLQTTGATPTAANDLAFKVSAPNGRSVYVGGNFSGQSLGPVTLTANSPVEICSSSPTPPPPPCDNPDETLNPPYVGTAGDLGLSFFEGLKMKGTWTVAAFDGINNETSTLNLVSLRITPAPTSSSSSK